jgi:hypothetical protein
MSLCLCSTSRDPLTEPFSLQGRLAVKKKQGWAHGLECICAQTSQGVSRLWTLLIVQYNIAGACAGSSS